MVDIKPKINQESPKEVEQPEIAQLTLDGWGSRPDSSSLSDSLIGLSSESAAADHPSERQSDGGQIVKAGL